jgi:ubiquinone biosynthesis protein Coq4
MQDRSVQFKDSIMRRVYAVWFLKKVASPAAVKLALLGLFLLRLKEYVSVRHVIANAPSLTEIGVNLKFFASAFANAEFAVQFLSFGLATLSLWFVADLFRGYSFWDSNIRRTWSRASI